MVNGDEPVGSVGNIGDDKYDPEERTRAVVGKEFKFDKNEIPFGLFIVEKSEIPSVCEPERQKEVSNGPFVKLDFNWHPSFEEIIVDLVEQLAQEMLP